MTRIVVFVFIFLSVLKSYGQKQHLEPTTFNVGGSLEIYYSNLNKLLFNEMADKLYSRFVVIPSFSKEYAYSVEKKNNEYFIISTSLSENYWRAKDKTNVNFEIKKTRIGKILFEKIVCLFELLAKQTKSYDTINYKTDGDNYYFITTNNNRELQIGETWSPSENSLMGNLIKISNKIYSIGNGNSITEINTEIDTFINELKK
jgi:hypothetical protein